MSAEDQEQYICLMNDEGQYSLWFAWKEVPPAWKQVGAKGTKEQCLSYIKENWVDMRTNSLKKKMHSIE